jgi:hypothetical protein
MFVRLFDWLLLFVFQLARVPSSKLLVVCTTPPQSQVSSQFPSICLSLVTWQNNTISIQSTIHARTNTSSYLATLLFDHFLCFSSLTHIACCSVFFFFFFLSAAGELFAWGGNQNGQLGMGDYRNTLNLRRYECQSIDWLIDWLGYVTNSFAMYPMHQVKIKGLNKKTGDRIEQIACGINHCLALTGDASHSIGFPVIFDLWACSRHREWMHEWKAGEIASMIVF